MFLSQPEPVKAAAPEAALAVKTQILKSTSVTLEVQSQGTVQPRTRTSLISEVSGAVLEVRLSARLQSLNFVRVLLYQPVATAIP